MKNNSTTAVCIEADQLLLNRINNRFLVASVLGLKLPLAFFAGLRVESCTTERCAVSLPYGWRSQNPFRSIYFGAQCMAAELSTGALGFLITSSVPKPDTVAMLVTGMSATFSTKATSRTTFICSQGANVRSAIEETLSTGEDVRVRMNSVGHMESGEEVARFEFEWSFRKRK